MPPSLHPNSRTLAIARFLRAAAPAVNRRSGGRRAIQRQPDTIRLEYFKAMMPIVRAQTKHLAAIRGQLVQLLYEERWAQGKMDSDRGRRAKAEVDRAGKQAADAFRPRALEQVAEKFGKRTAEHQKRELDKQVRQAIGVPLVSIEKPVRDLIPGFVTDNVALVKTVAERYRDRLEKAVSDAFESGMHPSTLAERLVEIDDMAESDARRIARDQIGKLNAEINEERQTAMGVERYVWRTTKDNRVRDEHDERDGETFAWSDPPAGGHPGEEIQCRCWADPDLYDIIGNL